MNSITNDRWEHWLNKWFGWLLLLGILVNASGLLLPVLEPDGALYAGIAKTIALSNDFINLKVEGKDWLDKPHLPFWITAISYKIFGINAFAYKLPGLLMWLAGAYYTYVFARKLYGKPTAQLAVLIYLSVEHLIISNNDVRAEPYLTGLMIGAAYYYYRAWTEKKWKWYTGGAFLLALAVMTKGIFIAVILFSGFVIEWFIRKLWNEFLNYRWWVSIALMLLFIMPELISLYLQFDLHPEKTVFGQTHVSGIRFFFWDSQFGRFFNTGPIKGEGSPFFFLHTLLWAFLPWPVILYIMVASKCKNLRATIYTSRSYICPGIGITGFLVFSLSRFQLPHYLNILYPFFAIVMAGWLVKLRDGVAKKVIVFSQYLIFFLLLTLCIGLAAFFGIPHIVAAETALVIVAITGYLLFQKHSLPGAMIVSFIGIMAVNLFLNICMYPSLFKYQAGTVAASFLQKQSYQGPVYMLADAPSDYAFHFYYNGPVYWIDSRALNEVKEDVLIYTPHVTAVELQNNGYHITEEKQFAHFHISQLTGTFINQRTRHQAVDYFVLARVKHKG